MQRLLDISATPRKPQFNMASGNMPRLAVPRFPAFAGLPSCLPAFFLLPAHLPALCILPPTYLPACRLVLPAHLDD